MSFTYQQNNIPGAVAESQCLPQKSYGTPLLHAYYEPGTILGTWHVSVTKTDEDNPVELNA